MNYSLFVDVQAIGRSVFLVTATLMALLINQPVFGQKYGISFKTSSVSGAGTDANISVQLVGTDGETDFIPISNKFSGNVLNQEITTKLTLGNTTA